MIIASRQIWPNGTDLDMKPIYPGKADKIGERSRCPLMHKIMYPSGNPERTEQRHIIEYIVSPAAGSGKKDSRAILVSLLSVMDHFL